MSAVTMSLPSLSWPLPKSPSSPRGGLLTSSFSSMSSDSSANDRSSADDYLLMEAGGMLGEESSSKAASRVEEDVETLQLTISRRSIRESLGFGELFHPVQGVACTANPLASARGHRLVGGAARCG